MKKVILFFVLASLLFVGYFFLSQQPNEKLIPPKQPTTQATNTPQATDFTASFAIFTNGTFRIFTDKRYHNLNSTLYIDPSEPNVIHVKAADATWNDFFATLPMKLTSRCLTTGTQQTFCTGQGGTLRFFINGEEHPDVLNNVIREGDQLLVTFGNATDEQIRAQLQQVPQAAN